MKTFTIVAVSDLHPGVDAHDITTRIAIYRLDATGNIDKLVSTRIFQNVGPQGSASRIMGECEWFGITVH